jgi:hypothetical protein
VRRPYQAEILAVPCAIGGFLTFETLLTVEIRARFCAFTIFAALGCNSTLDAGHNRPHGLLPVDERNPIVLVNDGPIDNWSGEYAVLLAAGGVKFAGIVVNSNVDWPDIQSNIDGWRDLISAARASGVKSLPDPIASVGSPLVVPDSGEIDDTQGNRSEGARFIVDVSKRLALPYRPIVVATGGALTDVADAYLVDPTVTERVVVVSSLGSVNDAGGGMGLPNGVHDPWADKIVVERFRYVQVSAFYDQLTDVPASSVPDLPDNELGAWIASKQPNLWDWMPASDQVSVLAASLPTFATVVERVSPATPSDASTSGPDLHTDPAGSAWLVTECDGAAATARFWETLLETSQQP